MRKYTSVVNEVIKDNPTICEGKIQAGNTGLPHPQEVAFKYTSCVVQSFFAELY